MQAALLRVIRPSNYVGVGSVCGQIEILHEASERFL